MGSSLLAGIAILLGCSAAPIAPTPPAAGPTGTARSGTAPSGTDTALTTATPDHLEVVGEGRLERSTDCLPAAVAPSDLPAAADPGAFLPPEAVVAVGVPATSGESVGDWFVAERGLVQIDLDGGPTATAAYRLPDGCAAFLRIERGTDLDLITCDEGASSATESCTLQRFDTVAGRFDGNYDIPYGMSPYGNVPLPFDGFPIVLTPPSVPDPPEVATMTLVDAATGTWHEVAMPCDRSGVELVADEGAPATAFRCEDEDTTVRYDAGAPFARRSVTRSVEDMPITLCSTASVTIQENQDRSTWSVVTADGSVSGSATAAPIPAPGYGMGPWCTIEGDEVAFSYATLGAAIIELRRLDDLSIIASTSWPSQAVSRNPAPAAASLAAVDGRRVWLVGQSTLAHVDL